MDNNKFMKNYVIFAFVIQLFIKHGQSSPYRCDSSAIEHFFNIIFSEFQNVPPSCVCVQMCPDQATYCYPNNCFKPVNKKRTEETISKIQGHKTQPFMFIVDQEKDLMDIFKDQDSNKGRTESPLNEFILRPNPFKELVLKHKRLPKLEMRYNLREQVKNTKSDKLKGDSINLSKTRWPMNKQVFHSKQPRSEIKHFKGNDDTRQSKFFASMFSEHEPVNYTPKYLTKYLTKRDSGDVNLETLFLYKTDAANFSLETLIDNMIESSLDDTINPSIDLNIYMNNSSDLSSRKVLRNTNKRDEFNKSKTNEVPLELNVVSLNATNETVDRNKYTDDIKVHVNQSVIDMIEEMSDEIEKQNNISFTIIEKITGSKLDVIMNEVPRLVQDTKETVNKKRIALENISNSDSFRNLVKLEVLTTTLPSINRPITMKSKRQRIVRKLRNRKHEIEISKRD